MIARTIPLLWAKSDSVQVLENLEKAFVMEGKLTANKETMVASEIVTPGPI